MAATARAIATARTFHFLRGLLYCAECREAGRDSRLVYSQNTGNGGTYEYYVCTAKQRGLCTMRTVRLDEAEAAVARAVASQRFPETELADIRDEVRRALVDMQAADIEEKDALRARLRTLEEQEDRLVELAAEGTIASSKLRDRLESVTMQKGAIAESLARTGSRIQRGADMVFAYVDLLDDPAELYESIVDSAKRDLLGAFFDRIDVLVSDDDLRISPQRTEINEALHEWKSQHSFNSQPETFEETRRASRISAEGSPADLNRLTQSKGLNKPVLVGLTGFEPATP
ncbi:zinc ribbon domain-containing protein [Curtobacterium sp. 458]|uniref:zinc ribbon domain-containing protein n=1 Tax=Curtobacterium sp. 458 TaxID=3050069 RepID=UPI0025B2C751|nr:zinc ribbon domain-containing protein [Curtobacterium sp. 458]WJX99924.1 zinc ribbon domain-containing protein [Curtobacterium sp. 458]